MIIDVGNEASNLWLNLCFWLIVLSALASILPWGTMGATRMAGWLRWAWLPVAMLAIPYEALMPIQYDIRIDLFLLIPMYIVVIVTSIFRWRRQAKSEG